tara:strand:- start:1177 stop:1530 length:354 start_codon:yes stop_codon:yes gene_type:complete
MKQIIRKNDIQSRLESRECTIVEVNHIWHQPSDRWIYIEKHEDNWIGLNFMQGDEYELFKEEYCIEDRALSTFFDEMKNDELPFDLQLEKDGDVEYIDKIIWIFYKAKASIFNFSSL